MPPDTLLPTGYLRVSNIECMHAHAVPCLRGVALHLSRSGPTGQSKDPQGRRVRELQRQTTACLCLAHTMWETADSGDDCECPPRTALSVLS